MPEVRLFVFACAVFSIPGCGEEGPERLAITGTVTLDERPVAAGYLSIVPKESGPATSAEIANGSFKVSQERGPVAGEYMFRLSMPLQKAMTNPQEPEPDEIFETTTTINADVESLNLEFVRPVAE